MCSVSVSAHSDTLAARHTQLWKTKENVDAAETLFTSTDLLEGLYLARAVFFTRDRMSVLISVCETHLRSTREMVRADGKRSRARTHTHRDAQVYSRRKHTQLYLCQSIRRCWETARNWVGWVVEGDTVRLSEIGGVERERDEQTD